MDTQENSLADDLLAGFNDADDSGATPGADSAKDKNPDKPEAKPEERIIAAEKRAAAAEARLEMVKESEKSKEQPAAEKDFLQEAIDSLSDEDKEQAEKIKPLLAKIVSSQKEGYISKGELEKLLSQHNEDSKNIAHLEIWKDKMSKEWDGKDGKPKFEWDKLHEFMQKKGYRDPMDSFYLLNKKTILMYAASLAKKPPKSLDHGGRSPSEDKAYVPPKDKNEALNRMSQKGAERLAQHGL